MKRPAIVLLAALLLPSAVCAQDVVHAVLMVEGKQVPLPEGNWVRAGTADDDDGIVRIALLRLEAGEVKGGVLVQVNREEAPAIWGTAPACSRSDLPFARIRYVSDHDGSCAFAAEVDSLTEPAPDPAWSAALASAQESGWVVPMRWAESAIRVSDPLAAVQVRYAFALPPGAPFPPNLPAWTEMAWDRVEHGMLNQLDPHKPLPGLDAVAAPRPHLGDAQTFVIPRAVWKTLTFRAMVTTLDFTSNLVAIGNFTTAAMLSAWGMLTGPWVYLGHELLWDYFATPTATQLELPGIGSELPVVE